MSLIFLAHVPNNFFSNQSSKSHLWLLTLKKAETDCEVPQYLWYGSHSTTTAVVHTGVPGFLFWRSDYCRGRVSSACCKSLTLPVSKKIRYKTMRHLSLTAESTFNWQRTPNLKGIMNSQNNIYHWKDHVEKNMFSKGNTSFFQTVKTCRSF